MSTYVPQHTDFYMSSRVFTRSAFLVVALTGCADNLAPAEAPETPPVPGDRATVTGHTVDGTGAPIAGATVTVRASGERATSDSAGAFRLDVPASTTLTIEATSPAMATTLLSQFMIETGATTSFEIPLLTRDRIKGLTSLGTNTSGGAVAIVLKSVSGAERSASGATVELAPSNLGRILYIPDQPGMADPDPSLTSIARSNAPVAWAVGVQPHVSVMTFSLRGATQVAAPYAMDDVTYPGTFTVDAGALTLVTLFTP
jgi:Carboxypeptidase regulatory-like domain